MARIGLFGGTFNPVHNGHIHLAEEAVSELGLSKLILIPSNIPPHKEAGELCSCEDRVQMCWLAAEGKENFEVSLFEINQGGKSYSYYTVEHFSELYPDEEIFLLTGSDMLLSFEKWFRFEDILKKVTLAVVSREYDDSEQIVRKAEELSGFGKIKIISSRPYPVSSTEIRRRIRNGEKYSCYLPEKVVQYIRLKNLYI